MSKKRRNRKTSEDAPATQEMDTAAPPPVMRPDTVTSPAPAAQEAIGAGLDQERREDIRGVMISVVNGKLLLPNASIAEVLSYADPDQVENTPDWLLGRIRWRGWQLPLVSFSKLADLGGEQVQLGNKVIVLRALGGNPKFPYFAMLTQGFPRLVTLAHDGLVEHDQDEPLPICVLSRVGHNEDVAMVPDIVRLEVMIGEVLAQAA